MIEYICEELVKQYQDCDEEFFQDTACYALTRLPARYIRHDIDMIFYLAQDERAGMLRNVKQAVEDAPNLSISGARRTRVRLVLVGGVVLSGECAGDFQQALNRVLPIAEYDGLV